jgi:hypothetical protein
LNASNETQTYRLPPVERGSWRLVVDTAKPEPGAARATGRTFALEGRAVALLVHPAPKRAS